MSRTKLFVMAVMVFIGAVLGSMFGAQVAKADVYVCDYLDARPTIAGVEDLVAIGITQNGMTPREAGMFIGNEVRTLCPRHLLTIQMYINKWVGPGYVV